MTHANIIIDSDTHFFIDAATRQIRNTASSKISVMQNDHNSERLTFSIPRIIEGHDMSTSDTIEIHYINVDAASKEQTTGIYVPDDVKVETSGDSEIVIFSWLLSRNATQHVGSLTFVVRFACFKDDVVDYAWHTAPFSGMSVGETLDCSGAIEGEYLDIIAAWEKEHIEPLQKTVEEVEEKLNSMTPGGNADIEKLFELEHGKNILIPDSESGYYSGTTPKTSTNHIRTPNPIPIESGHSLLTITTDLTEGNADHYLAVIWLDEAGTQISTNSIKTSAMVNNNDGTLAWEIPNNAVSALFWLSGVKANGISNFENFSMQYDNYGIAVFEPYIEAKTVLKKDNLAYGVHPLNGKTIVNFGDSIFGNRRPPNDISTEIARLTGATVHNCGFGGCRMSSHTQPTQFAAFSMYRLADAIANNDWTLQDTAVSQTGWGMPSYFPEALTLLKSIDFSKVDIITIAYGTNDFASGKGLSDAENNKDTTTFAGALRYSIETLLGAYPHLKIFVCSQIYRFWLDDNGEFSADSDTKMFGGVKLTEYVAKTKEVAEEYHIPYIDNYNIGMNKCNRSVYFSSTDGTHPIPAGCNLMAANIAKKLF